jgi:hypothetical protein
MPEIPIGPCDEQKEYRKTEGELLHDLELGCDWCSEERSSRGIHIKKMN